MLSVSGRRLFPCYSKRFNPIMSNITRRLSFSKSELGVSVDGTVYPYIWLRDSCLCTSCIHPSTKQKLHRTSDITMEIRPKPEGIQTTHDGIQIEWTTGHKSTYPASFLKSHSSPSRLSESHKDFGRQTWNKMSLSKAKSLFLPYESLQNPSVLLAAINQLSRFGLLFVTGVPNTETSDQTCELRKLASLFGEIRSTFYGETWDVKNIRNSKNVAYTNLDLGLHMDLLYFEHPPRYQVLHSLRNRVVGGMSVFVDAIQAASTLRAINPKAFEILASTPVSFNYINDGHHLHHSHPTIELAAFAATESLEEPRINHINYSPPFQAPLPLSTTPPAFYPALSEFTSLLDQPGLKYEYLLQEGDAVMFDNRRVLHARTAFDDRKGEEGATNRWLKGCYLEADALLDRGRVLSAGALNVQ